MGLLRLINWFLLFTFLILGLTKEENCPPKCLCGETITRCWEQENHVIPNVSVTIRALDLRFNNYVVIDPGSFAQYRQLRTLVLNDNGIVELQSGVFTGLRRLRSLYLYRNKIRHIDHDVFHVLLRLEHLYLHMNEIHHLAPDTFHKLAYLDKVYLQNNKLQGLARGAFMGSPMVKSLRLDNNPLVCNCALIWLVQWRNIDRTAEITGTCYGPPHVAGMTLQGITLEDFDCSNPVIEIDPEDLIVLDGEDAMFNCVASGEPTPIISWYRGTDIKASNDLRYEVLYNGTLMVRGAEERDSGIIECVATNDVGETRSRRARMIIQPKLSKNDLPQFVISPQKKSVKVNHPLVTFDCIAKGKPKPHVSWYFNEERILLSERNSIQPNGSFAIHNVQATDAGFYTCEVENINGKIVASAELKVLTSPVIITAPKDKIVITGEKVKFTCRARGSPTPTIMWFLDTMDLPDNDNFKLSTDNQTLTILEASTDDEGMYHCRAENTEGLTEISAVLKVSGVQSFPPRITVKPDDTDAFKGTSIQMPCEFESEPPATVEWRKDGSRVMSDNRISITLFGSLVINNVTVLDTGTYECSGFNELGRDTASATLVVKDHILPGDQYVNIALTQATRDVDQAISRTVEQLFNNRTENVDIKNLYAISRYPNAPARDVARAAEIYERTLDKVKDFVRSGLKITSAEPFNYQGILSNEHLEVIARLSGCVAHREEKDCSDMCYHSKYRSIDGSCNNFVHPMWGASLTNFRRILYPIYENGFSQPTGWNKDLKYNGFVLPSARLVSTTIITTEIISEDIEITHMAMQWGQWLDHDLDHALPSVSSETWDGVDCKKTCDYSPPCFPIDVPPNDPRITNRRCIDFIRTSSVCGSGMTSALFGKLQPREQINQLTSFLDASQVYGFQKDVAEDLRDLTNDNGQLRVGFAFSGKKPFLPTSGLNAMDCRRNLQESTRNCFVAGDIRANEQIGLAAMHTIWMREHNRLAKQLKNVNPIWDGDRLYNEARKIVGAQMQLITFEDWLPIIIGPDGYTQLGKYTGYNSSLNPSISNVFATAALRFGHSMINPVLHRYDENFETIPQGHLQLRHAFFSPWRLVDEGGVDPLLRGMFTTPAKLKTSTQNLNSELTEKLFYSAHAVALDLAAINIQRGRDHGLPPYTKWRQFCGMSEVNSFDDLSNEITDETVRNKLEELYGSVHNIDVWVGGILEDQVEGGKVGPLFRCILVDQFRRLRDGDRFWYENPTMFEPVQLEQIKQTSLARVLCDNGDNIDTIGENVFVLPEVQDGLVSCADLTSIDLRYWADCDTCDDFGSTDRSTRRTRRAVSQEKDMELDYLDNAERLNNLEYTQQDMSNTVKFLKERIVILEKKCERN